VIARPARPQLARFLRRRTVSNVLRFPGCKNRASCGRAEAAVVERVHVNGLRPLGTLRRRRMKKVNDGSGDP